MALAYLLGKPAAKTLKVNLNIPLVFVLSIIPDIDILFQSFFTSEIHRGPTHSVITAIVVFIPFFVLYRQKAVPYFIALISHSLVGDFFIGGQIQLFWPLTTQEFGLHELGFYYIGISSRLNIILELTLFTVATIVMIKNRDLLSIFKSNMLNLVLTVPIFTVLLPTFLGFPLSVPILLVPPHLFYLAIFSLAFLMVILRKTKQAKLRG
jgi:hypothetical protein